MAVYTEVSDSALIEHLTKYDIGELSSIKGIAEGVENSNYLLTTTKGRYILTLYEARVDTNDLPFFLGLMEHLAQNGLSCPLPIVMKNGETLGTLENKPAAIISFLDGFSVKRPSADHCKELGKALAQLHMAGEGFSIKRANALAVADWRPLFEKSEKRADEVIVGLSDKIKTELDFLERNWPHDLPKGVIHADMFTDNVFFLQNKFSGIIDFYFACNDLLAYDIAICLNDWCFEPDWSFNITKARALLGGYRSVRPLSQAELEALPVLCRGAALRFLLTRLFDWLNVPVGAMVTPKNPSEYIEKLKFHKGVNSVALYGIDVNKVNS
ncbi:MAG: homoserine kinase [Hyphomicrobiales bacterium]|nr:homoserine kinase [Hyphomicrobiales bacterium]PCH50246.1 MAG: homoserine kinase [Hyphomicrobiales bacterium]